MDEVYCSSSLHVGTTKTSKNKNKRPSTSFTPPALSTMVFVQWSNSSTPLIRNMVRTAIRQKLAATNKEILSSKEIYDELLKMPLDGIKVEPPPASYTSPTFTPTRPENVWHPVRSMRCVLLLSGHPRTYSSQLSQIRTSAIHLVLNWCSNDIRSSWKTSKRAAKSPNHSHSSNPPPPPPPPPLPQHPIHTKTPHP